MRYFYTSDSAEQTLRDGFCDTTAPVSYGGRELTGVRLTSKPLDFNWTVDGNRVLFVELPDDLRLDEYEVVEALKTYREWCVPAELLNTHATVTAATEEPRRLSNIRGGGLI